MKRFICVHGHFYQPPRENPWLETIEVQDSAYPYHDWNERITAECFAPNAACRILDGDDRIVRIVNNYARMSFNFGPTLLSWLEVHAPEVYEAVLEADRQSQRTFSGHGNALAQAYNHVILPLSTRRQKELQVVWGIRDFQRRFGRDPEGFWLPETAVDLESLEVLAEHDIRFTILAPHQADRVRGPKQKSWKEVEGDRVDTARPYRLELPSGAEIVLFFYDGPISRAVAFEHLLNNGENFARRLAGAFSDDVEGPQLVHLATDGETYGHHHRFGDMALAFALDFLERNELARLTNYGEYLESHPPEWEAQIVENSSWSCLHGIERWREDCGCCSGSRPHWNQRWRAPLRKSLDWLDDRADALFEEEASGLLQDPRRALEDYVEVILDRSGPALDRFLGAHAAHPLEGEQRVRLLQLLEMQRFAALMYTSCAWFFDEISGLETSRALQYAGRVVQLAREAAGRDLEKGFLRRLEQAPSNLSEHGDGRRIYEKWVRPARVDLLKVGAHFALSSLFEPYGESNPIFCYTVRALEPEHFEAPGARASVGIAQIASRVTEESAVFAYSAIHLGDHNLTGGVRPFRSHQEFHALRDEVRDCVARADVADAVQLLDRSFPGHIYRLDSLFRDEQRKILDIILEAGEDELEETFTNLYQQKLSLMLFLENLRLPLPRALALTAQFVLDTRLRRALQAPEFPMAEIEEVLDEAETRRIRLGAPGARYGLERRLRELAQEALVEEPDPASLERLESTLDLVSRLHFKVDLWSVQNLYWKALQDGTAEAWDAALQERFRRLGEKLRIEVPRPRGAGILARDGG